MALRNQPYLPLYVQDVLTDEKLIECSALAHGVYFRLLCILHKQEIYGTLTLKSKYKEPDNSKIENFATMLSIQMPFDKDTVTVALRELCSEGVITISEEELSQKRMIKDAAMSDIRAKSGAKGGKLGRDSGTKRFYNEPGFLYLVVSDQKDGVFKIGISKEPHKRLRGIQRKSQYKKLRIIHTWDVEDMGKIEQIILDHFNDIRDGEWLYGDYQPSEIQHIIGEEITKAKRKQNESKI